MYTQEDFESYIKEIIELERNMKKNIEEIMPHIKDKNVLATLNAIYHDEGNHEDILNEAIKIIRAKA